MSNLDALGPSFSVGDTGRLSRRRVLTNAGALSIVAAGLSTSVVAAQNATPSASPVAPEVPSDEATADQLLLAKQQGDAYGQALAAMANQATVVTKSAGDFEISLVAEKAEGLYVLQGSKLQWTDPGENNIHLEVAPRDAGDGRFVPGLDIALTLKTSAGDNVGQETMPLVWHPWLYHYGKNWKVPGDGTYHATVRIEPFTLDRHDQENGQRYTEAVEVEFDIELTTGQK